MDRARLLLVAVVATLVAAACGDETFDPMDPRLEGARLEIVGSPAVNLRYGQTTELRVRYVDADGMPIANAPIDFDLPAVAGGSRLSALQTSTTSGGEAAVDLTAGDSDAMFQVQVTPPIGDDVFFDIAVSDTDLGTIVVSISYAGDRDLNRVDTFLYDGVSCSSLTDVSLLPTAIRMAPSASSVAAMPAFAGVPVGNDYTVAVRAQTGGVNAAFGCRDGIVVQAREETAVNISLMDLEIPPDFAGVWDLDNRFDFGGALPGSVGTFVDVLDELTDDSSIDGERFSDEDMDGVFPEYGQDPGVIVTAVVMRQTCRWRCASGENYSTCSETDHRLGDLSDLYLQDFTSWDPAQSRFTGGCGGWEFAHTLVQMQINDTINRFLPDFVTNWALLAGDLARAINNAHITSILTINRPMAGAEFDLPMTHELQEMIVVVRDPTSEPPGLMREFRFSLADAGFRSLEATETLTVEGTTLTIPEHSFNLNWGELVLYIYREIILNEIFGYMDTGALLADLIDCTYVGNKIVEGVCSCETEIPGDCDGCIISPSTARGYCTTGLTATGGAIEGAIAGFLDSEGTLTIRGTAEAGMVNESNAQVGQLNMGVWAGRWGEGMMTDNITGTFTGTPRSAM